MTNGLEFDSIVTTETIQASFNHRSGSLDSDRKLKIAFHGVKVTIDVGLLEGRELDEVLGLTTMIESELADKA